MTEKEKRALYAQEMGEQALEKQLRLAKEECVYCGVKLKARGAVHHPLCKLR